MFTPPQSPLPNKRAFSPRPDVAEEPESTIGMPASPSDIVKRQIGRRTTRWAMLLVPLVVIFITVSTQYLTGPVAFDAFAKPPEPMSWEKLTMHGHGWTHHKREPAPAPQLASLTSTSTSGAPTPTTTNATPVPTVPSSPPDLPTPFPQPFDADITQNFSSISCFNFFSNMTNTPAFRTCRPLSLLLESSNTFIEAQNNLTLLNSLMWGTCNTNTAKDQCVSNMNWFADALQSACAQDIKDRNTMTLTTLTALQAYSVTRDAGCITDPTTNTYCYVNAVRNTNPSDSYFYQMPLGIGVPKTATPLCSACTRSVMGIYAAALEDPAQAPTLTGLKKTYSPAADLAVQQCGAGYAQVTTSGGVSMLRGLSGWTGALAVLLCSALLFAGP
ncbi:hypothetical protein Hypma_013965 [Hypsizygus marmoreus]|uniref:DUF7729 domain-containing protein n=1 Tax=Hypsizygus marmoreus TaxID=39966 RepID=A0A369K740_HYPMA|nr:hypothetical protein Hypma_013965 [Hypsizygus marmoreus]